MDDIGSMDMGAQDVGSSLSGYDPVPSFDRGPDYDSTPSVDSGSLSHSSPLTDFTLVDPLHPLNPLSPWGLSGVTQTPRQQTPVRTPVVKKKMEFFNASVVREGGEPIQPFEEEVVLEVSAPTMDTALYTVLVVLGALLVMGTVILFAGLAAN